MLNKIIQVPYFTSLGIVMTGIIWLTVFGINKTTIEFDGPAGVTLAISLIISGLFFGIISLIVNGYRKKNKLFYYINQFFITYVISVVIIGYLASQIASIL